MNNVTFGDENIGYYETVAGGAGAVSYFISFRRFTACDVLRSYPPQNHGL